MMEWGDAAAPPAHWREDAASLRSIATEAFAAMDWVAAGHGLEPRSRDMGMADPNVATTAYAGTDGEVVLGAGIEVRRGVARMGASWPDGGRRMVRAACDPGAARDFAGSFAGVVRECVSWTMGTAGGGFPDPDRFGPTTAGPGMRAMLRLDDPGRWEPSNASSWWPGDYRLLAGAWMAKVVGGRQVHSWHPPGTAVRMVGIEYGAAVMVPVAQAEESTRPTGRLWMTEVWPVAGTERAGGDPPTWWGGRRSRDQDQSGSPQDLGEPWIGDEEA